MTSKEMLKAAALGLKDFMKENGYSLVKSYDYVSRGEEIDKRIVLAVVRWSGSRVFRLDHYLQLRVHKVEELVNPYKVYIEKKEWPRTPTIARYFSNFCPKDFDLKSISLLSEDGLPEILKNFKQICKSYSFPFLDRFSSFAEIEASYMQPQDHWPSNDRFIRFEILLAASVFKVDRVRFEELFKETMGLCEKFQDGRAIDLANVARGLKKDYFP